MGDKEVYCENCEVSGTLNSGSPHGSFYSCENDCGNYVCVKCLLENEKYQEMLKSVDGISNLEKIECISCLG